MSCRMRPLPVALLKEAPVALGNVKVAICKKRNPTHRSGQPIWAPLREVNGGLVSQFDFSSNLPLWFSQKPLDLTTVARTRMGS